MSDPKRTDPRWLVKQMEQVVQSPLPSRTVIDSASNAEIAQGYVREVSSQLALSDHEDDGDEIKPVCF
jgi:hypothetical protein